MKLVSIASAYAKAAFASYDLETGMVNVVYRAGFDHALRGEV